MRPVPGEHRGASSIRPVSTSHMTDVLSPPGSHPISQGRSPQPEPARKIRGKHPNAQLQTYRLKTWPVTHSGVAHLWCRHHSNTPVNAIR